MCGGRIIDSCTIIPQICAGCPGLQRLVGDTRAATARDATTDGISDHYPVVASIELLLGGVEP